jgi:sodium transport system permease protein
LCLALAAFARSTKEGQYYLMPLVLVTMPLVILPMAPGVELNLGNSLIPISGVVLLLRAMLEVDYVAVLPYTPIVVVVTLGCCLLAIRWATAQFSSESVLFRESERWGVSVWIRHLVRDRGATPSLSEAMFCGVLILLIKFFMSFPLAAADFVTAAAVTQLVVVATPALLMTVMLTRSPAQTLLLRRFAVKASLAAVALAVALHPAANVLQVIVNRVYPLGEQTAQALNNLVLDQSLPVLLFLLALLPAVCEELAFRGFILSGLRHLGHKWTAIVVSSIFFGAAHALLQQSISAFVLGIVLGFIAVQAGSLVPCVVFHAVHNAMPLLVRQFSNAEGRQVEWLAWLLRGGAADEPLYRWPVIALSVVAGVAILYWFHRLPYARTPEESLQEAIEHHCPVTQGLADPQN